MPTQPLGFDEPWYTKRLSTFPVMALVLGSLLLLFAASPARADVDLLVAFPLDEGMGTLAGDSSGNANNGTLANGASFEDNSGDESPFAVRFDGLDDLIDLGVLDANGTGLTLAAWFNASGFPGKGKDPRLISKASGTGWNDHVFMLSTIKLGSAVRMRGRVRLGGVT